MSCAVGAAIALARKRIFSRQGILTVITTERYIPNVPKNGKTIGRPSDASVGGADTGASEPSAQRDLRADTGAWAGECGGFAHGVLTQQAVALPPRPQAGGLGPCASSRNAREPN